MVCIPSLLLNGSDKTFKTRMPLILQHWVKIPQEWLIHIPSHFLLATSSYPCLSLPVCFNLDLPLVCVRLAVCNINHTVRTDKSKAACKPNTQGLQAAYITLRFISMDGCPRLRALVASAHAPLCGLWLRQLARCLRCGLGWQWVRRSGRVFQPIQR